MFQTGTFKLGVDVQQILDSADVKVTLQDTSVTARPDDG